MKKIHVLAAAVTVALASTLAVAQTRTASGHARPDTNGDGVIERSEAAAFPKLAERFDQLDKNKDGRLTADERPQHARGMRGGRQGGARGAQLKALDADKDGRISRAEARPDARLGEHFATLDANHDGYLDRSDRLARKAAKRAEFFAGADANRDGRLTRDEFVVEQGARSAERRAHMAEQAKAAGKQDRMRPAPTEAERIERAGKAFERMDADNNGTVSKAEFDAFKPMHKGRGMRHGGGMRQSRG
jgi:Ca2+-binding EF-hand superfamily protein